MKFTVGIAVYNVEKYIDLCIKSLINQKYDDVEIIIVNDGSIDNSGKICDKFAKLDSRIRVIHQENCGVSNVRNRIIEEASGEWLAFVDGDDIVSNDFFEIMHKNIDDKFDMILFDMQFFVYDNAIASYSFYTDDEVVKGNDIKDFAMSTMYKAKNSKNYINCNMRSSVAKLFKTSVLKDNNIKFLTQVFYGEDVLFNLSCLNFVSTIKLVRYPIYFYRQNQNSVVHRYNKNIIDCNTKLSALMKQYVIDFDDKNMETRLKLRLIADFYAILELDLCHKDNPKSFVEREKDFENLCNLSWTKEIFNEDISSMLTDQHRQAYNVFKTKDFKKIMKFFRKNRIKESLKIIVNKTRLNKILKPIRDKLK